VSKNFEGADASNHRQKRGRVGDRIITVRTLRGDAVPDDLKMDLKRLDLEKMRSDEGDP